MIPDNSEPTGDRAKRPPRSSGKMYSDASIHDSSSEKDRHEMHWTSGYLWFLATVAACWLPEDIVGLTCLSGTDLAIPRDHVYVQKCGSHEVCFLDAFVSSNGYIKYNIGCRDRQFCTGSSSIGKRSPVTIIESANKRARDTKICDVCCDTQLCNSAGCGAIGYPTRSSRGPICYECSQQLGPGLCDKITLCGSDSVCKLRLQTPTGTGDVFYNSGCENKQTCENDASYSSALVGRQRRRYVHELLTASKSCLVKCCDGDLCTNTCGGTGHVAMVTTSAPQTALNPCHANPCAHGTCANHGSGYTCHCIQGYSGTNCAQHVTPSGCNVGWRKYGNHCYLIDKYQTATWLNAKLFCERHGGYLAEVDTDAENQFLLQASSGSLGGDWWLGGTDIQQEGRYVWSHSRQDIPHGSPYWGPHRPNNIVNSKEDEDCLEFQENIMAWNDEHCSASDHFICETQI